MDRFVVFLFGVYGKSVVTSINPLFDSMAKRYPDVKAFVIPENLTEYCHIITENDGQKLAKWLLDIRYDLGINTVFIFDRQTNILNLHKGIGSLQDLVDNHYDLFEREYQKSFDQEFIFKMIHDARILLRVAQQN